MNTEINARPYGVAPPEFTLPETTTLGPVHLQVSDLSRSLEYYRRIIGLHARETAGDTAVLTAHGDDRALVVLHTRRGVTRARRGTFGLYHFALLLPDRAALGRFAAHLAAQHIQVGMADHLVSEALYLSDPDGLGIEVYADRPRAAWRHRNRELAITTDPLDITSVIAAGRGETWDGAPKGTTMGHVHLHVGDLLGRSVHGHDERTDENRRRRRDPTDWQVLRSRFLHRRALGQRPDRGRELDVRPGHLHEADRAQRVNETTRDIQRSRSGGLR